MREIKFRAWHPEWEDMLLADMGMQFGKREFYPFEFQAGFSHYPKDDRWVLMQYTGLVDKDGVEIYEGDILTYGKRMYEVAISFNGYYLQRYKLWNGRFKPSFSYSMSLITKPSNKEDRGECGGVVDRAEVIGNRYQNPELISQLEEKE